MIHGIHRGYRTTCLVITLLRFIHPDIITKEFSLAHHKENEKQFHRPQGHLTSYARDEERNGSTIPMPTFAGMPSTMSSTIHCEFPQNYMVGQQRQQISELQFEKFPNPQSFCVEIRLKNQVTTCSDFPSDAMLWIKKVEMVDSVEEFKSSQSIAGENFPKFEMLDAKTASALNKMIHNSHFKKQKVSLEEQTAQKEDRFQRGRQIAFMINDYFRVTGAHDTVLGYVDLFSAYSS